MHTLFKSRLYERILSDDSNNRRKFLSNRLCLSFTTSEIVPLTHKNSYRTPLTPLSQLIDNCLISRLSINQVKIGVMKVFSDTHESSEIVSCNLRTSCYYSSFMQSVKHGDLANRDFQAKCRFLNFHKMPLN